MSITNEEEAIHLGNALFKLLNIFLKKQNKNIIVPKLEFNNSLIDNEFINLVKEAKEFALVNKTEEQLIEIENQFKNNESQKKICFSNLK